MHIVCIGAALVIIVREREDAGGMNAVDSNDPKVYVKDVVAVFKPLLGLTPQRKNFTTTTTSLRRCRTELVCRLIYEEKRLYIHEID